ncbi:cupin domain-containing protein [Halosolutus amylolyticus]|uniref:Cupin domain-containing protein n=2 Tax=Halosolutus amylolyticus TaxID=2932267 RepID=A0ABD5PJ70_9EURY|nr:cupin domain-containing protein [Halosolutus amylolyticus]
MYKVQTNRAEDVDAEGVQSTPIVIRTNEFRLLYFEMEPDAKIDWHTHTPGLDEVNMCLEGRAKYSLEREDGSYQTIEVGPMEFVYVPGGARHKIETVGDQVHVSLSAAKFDTIARLESLEDEDADGAETDETGWNDVLFVDRKRDEVVAMDKEFVSK